MILYMEHVFFEEGIRELELRIRHHYDCSNFQMMQKASNACFEYIKSHFPTIETITVVTGLGHNGGDGYLTAKALLSAGYKVNVVSCESADKLTKDVLKAHDEFVNAGGGVSIYEPGTAFRCDLIVDAIFGIG